MNNNPYTLAQAQLKTAANLIDLDPTKLEQLLQPARELTIHFPVKMDDGSVRVFTGFRVQHNVARGPAKGGIRFHAEETIDLVRALATWMTLKTALLDLPLGGGKGGVVVDDQSLSESELERVSRGYMRAIADFIGSEKDVPAPDVGTTPQIMAWMAEEYGKIVGAPTPGIITGKPVEAGGSEGRGDATARGGWIAIEEAAKEMGINLREARVAIQGFGNAGYYAAKIGVEQFNAKIVAVSDSKGVAYNAGGLDIEDVMKHKTESGSVTGCNECQTLDTEALLALDVDILIPAALEGAIHKENANTIQAPIVAEFANGPTTQEADKILFEKGIQVIPDFLANAGGVTVSYFEMQQNAAGEHWALEEVHQRLDTRMRKAYKETLEMAKSQGVDMRTAAGIVALTRIAAAMK